MSTPSTTDDKLPPLLKAYVDEQIQKAQDAGDLTRKTKWRNSWRQASPITRGSFWMTAALVFATIAYSVVAGFQLHEMRTTNRLTARALAIADQNSHDSGLQFLTQLRHFDAGLGVNSLQISKLDASIAQASRLATATEIANANVIDADRPWVGLSLRIDPPLVGKIATMTIVVANSGKRPANILRLQFGGGFYSVFPKEPDYTADGLKSQGILNPGA